MPPPPRVRPRSPVPARRARLALEQLESREVLSPVVLTPAFGPAAPETVEGAGIAFVGGPIDGGSSFGAFDVGQGETYTADLTATRGTLDLDAGFASEFGVSVANNGSSRVTLTGSISDIDAFLGNSGYTFTPDPFFSGEATVALAVADPLGQLGGYGEHPVRVLPVAQPPDRKSVV